MGRIPFGDNPRITLTTDGTGMKTRIIFLSMSLCLPLVSACKRPGIPPSSIPTQPAKEQAKPEAPKPVELPPEPKPEPIAKAPPEPKKEKTVIELILDDHAKTEPARLKALDGEFALLDKEKQESIIFARKALYDGSWGNMPGDLYQIYRTHFKFFHRGHMAWMRYTIGSSPECLEMITLLKLTDPRVVVAFQIQIGSENREDRLHILYAIKESCKVGVTNIDDDLKKALRPYKDFLGKIGT